MSLNVAPLVVPLEEDAYGVFRVGGTRVTLDTVIGFFLQGYSAEELADAFPTLELADIYAVIGYYLQRREDVDAYLKEREQQAAAIRREIEARPASRRFREQLAARRAARGEPPA
jgi:uncharacterized protein (DUF433 family)